MDTLNEAKSMSAVQRILERAIEVIDESGEVAIRTNPIAAECGVTPPILYRAFGSREGLVIAAQAERYRRATAAAADRLVELVNSATSRDDLIAKVSTSLDFIYAEHRSTNRLIRVSVLGSAVSRPQLQKAIAEVDAYYVQEIVRAYDIAVQKGWVSAHVNLAAIALWAQGLTNSRINVEFAQDSAFGAEWNKLSKRAVLDAIFD